MTITELMREHVKTCRQSDRLDHAAKLMWDFDIGAVPVVDELGRVVGMVTDRDVCMAAYVHHQPLRDIPVSVAMTTHIVGCRRDDTAAEVAQRMAKHKVRRIPVVDEAGRPVGIVSIDDLALAMARGHDVPAHEVAGTLAAICERRPIAGVLQTK